MHLTVFNIDMTRVAQLCLVLGLAPLTSAFAQVPTPLAQILSSEIAISRERAEIKLELEDGRKLTLATVAGAPGFQRNGDIITLGVERGGAVDRSWRELLNAAMDAQTSLLPEMLVGWQSPSATGTELDRALEEILLGKSAAAAGVAGPAAVAPGMNDSVLRLENKIEQLNEELKQTRKVAIKNRAHRGPDWLAPLRHVGRGISGIFAVLVTYAVLFGLGFAIVIFGGRKYIEGVADTVRAGLGRSFLVGLAGSFLLLPVFVLGVIVLAISIVGIPALLVWVPVFPIATLLAALLGFIGVAHAAGESWAERRYYGSEWFTRANSYYFMATGLTLLASFFVAANVIRMAGPWLGFINAILTFLGIMVTFTAICIGFGAVLISRGGSRVNGRVPDADDAPAFEESHA